MAYSLYHDDAKKDTLTSRDVTGQAPLSYVDVVKIFDLPKLEIPQGVDHGCVLYAPEYQGAQGIMEDYEDEHLPASFSEGEGTWKCLRFGTVDETYELALREVG